MALRSTTVRRAGQDIRHRHGCQKLALSLAASPATSRIRPPPTRLVRTVVSWPTTCCMSSMAQGRLGLPCCPTPGLDRKYRILFVDAYDSFSNNIVALLETCLDVTVIVVKIDLDLDRPGIRPFLSHFDAVVVGPGPGNPTNPGDTGFITELWRLQDDGLLPILGICLGFQTLACAFGATIERLPLPTHGILCEVLHDGSSIFQDVDEVSAIRYHSLHVKIGHIIQANQCVAYPSQLWEPTRQCPDLKPLAWDLDDKINGAVLMAVQHIKRPFWGLQYHPESICTNGSSVKIIANWWHASKKWLAARRGYSVRGASYMAWSHEQQTQTTERQGVFEHDKSSEARNASDLDSERLQSQTPARENARPKRVVSTIVVSGRDISAVKLCERLCIDPSEMVLLDTAAKREGTGRYSILGIVMAGQTVKIQYAAASDVVRTWVHQQRDGQPELKRVEKYDKGIWHHLSEHLEARKATGGEAGSPFWGGLMGYIPYEVGLASTGVPPAPREHVSRGRRRHDAIFACIERSVVIDHDASQIYIQSLLPDDGDWMERTRHTLDSTRVLFHPISGLAASPELDSYLEGAQIDPPDETGYREKISKCQDHIRAGESYELCLTAQTSIKIPRKPGKDMSWALYQRLRHRNPAPFGAYLKLGPATILSSSPERFLNWTRKGTCQMRPIKGTVQKGPDMTETLARELLAEPKERAENLMILDLIRHDLHGILGTGKVNVRQLMAVESYKTVWQLVSVIEGQLRNSAAEAPASPASTSPPHKKGLDVLAACLPPGSMTGAPKKRSCELLQTLEDHEPRGIYSGVLGYMCVGGSGDFSVVIRTACRWEDGQQGSDEGRVSDCAASVDRDKMELVDVWTIGAGGAITALSNEEDEWKEMQAKLQSTKAAFDVRGARRAKEGKAERCSSGSPWGW